MNFKKLYSIETLLLLIIPFIYLISWQSVFLSTFLAVSLVIFAFFLYNKTEDLLYFALGSVLGSIGEICVVHFGVWEYSKPLFLGIPLWLSLFWGYVFLLIRRSAYKVLDIKMISDKSSDNRKKYLLILPAIYLSLIFIPSILLDNNIAIFAGLIIINILLLHRADKIDIFFALTFSILGTILELICVYAGIWKYANPDILGIPLWLILLYSGFAVFIKKTADNLLYRK